MFKIYSSEIVHVITTSDILPHLHNLLQIYLFTSKSNLLQILSRNKRNEFTANIPSSKCKSLETPKGQSESVNRRRTDNTMAKRKKDKQESTKQTHKTKDRVTRTLLKTGDELRCSGRISSSCSTSGTRRVNLVTNPVISHE
jgi:arylamine N-acetyltransferase